MKAQNLLVLLIVALFIAGGATMVSAQADWKKLGDEHVNHDVDHDSIHIADSGRIRELRLRVDDAPIKFRRVVVTYKDDTKQDVEYLEDVSVGRFTRTISIPGDGHTIKKVEFWYETASLGGKKAHVTLFGRNFVGADPMPVVGVTADTVPAVAVAVPVSTDNWKKLGDEFVNFDIDHDSIHIADSGRFRELRLRVDDAPIKFRRVVITYKDDTKQDVEYLEDVSAGGFSRTIAIPGDGHTIKSIEFWYETASLGGKKAHVTLYGREYMSASNPMPVISVPVSVEIAPVPVTTVQTGWKKLGDEFVNFDVDHDSINIADSGRFRELRLRVDDAPIKFRRIVITYKDDTKQEVEYLEDVAVGGDSRSIAIPGDGHVIKSIEFWYETASLGGKKAHVTLYGRS